ncbi:MAG: class I SAM-dependent methyltransferase [Bacillota bacterium]|nr:class I SAM-dependent methyltransferase [Bacillota bacterium]
MLKLSDRLQRIADCVPRGSSLADVGSDHGFLPVYLRERGICEKLILTDIRKGPLEKAAGNIARLAPGGVFDLRLGNGLEPLAPGEVDTVVMAGMGGLLMADILGADPEKTASFKRFILQPRNAQDKLRLWLYKKGFLIKEEYLVREGRHLCEIIVTKKGPESVPEKARAAAAEAVKEDLVFEISPLLILKRDPLLKELIRRKMETEKRILRDVSAAGTRNGQRRQEEAEKRLAVLNDLLNGVLRMERMGRKDEHDAGGTAK